MVFTHFEDVAAPDLDWAGRKAKVLEGLSNAIQAIASLPKAQRVLLERTAESKAYFLARMDQPEVKLRSTQSELKRICEHFERSAGEPELVQFRPIFQRVRHRHRPAPRDRSVSKRLERSGTVLVSLENHGSANQLDRPRV